MAADAPGAAGSAGRVDAHHHVWDFDVRDEPWITGTAMQPIHRSFSVDDLRPHASAAGVTATVLVQTTASIEQTVDFLALAEADPLVGAVTGWVDLVAPNSAEQVGRLRSGAGGDLLRAVRHGVQDEPDPDWLDRADVRRGLRAVADTGLGYELLTLPHQLPAAIRVVSELDGAPFVLDHCSKPPVASGELEPWARNLRELATRPNVCCKLSGLVTEAGSGWSLATLRPYVEVALDAFGPDRIMFGSDWPVCLLAASYDGWFSAAEELTAGLSDAERDHVFAGTARRFYGL